MEKIADIFVHVSALDTSKKIAFYLKLGSNLTIAIRSIWSDASLKDAEKVDAIRVVNEVSHQVFNWITRLSRNDTEFNDQDCFSDIRNLATQNKQSAEEIGGACVASYRYVL